MCVALAALPAIAAGVSAAGAVAGAGLSYESGQNAAAAQRNAEQASFQQQNTAFNQRMNAQQQQLAATTAANEKSDQAFSTNAANTQAAQMAALGQTQNTTNQLNQNEQAIASAANNTIAGNVNNASAPALTNAQAIQTAAQESANAPIVAGIQASNPLGAASTGPTADAMAKSDAASAKYVKNYGDTQAVLGGYTAPITLANQSATNTGIGLMPIAAADQLLKGSAPSLLAPSQVAFANAGALGQTENTAAQSNQQQALQLADATAANNTDLANLQQQDSGILTQNQLTAQQQRAAALAGLGQGLTTISNTGLYGAGATGAFKGLSGAISGAVNGGTKLPAASTQSDPASGVF